MDPYEAMHMHHYRCDPFPNFNSSVIVISCINFVNVMHGAGYVNSIRSTEYHFSFG